MQRWMKSGCLFAMLGTASFALAASPFVGTWKLNQAKSHLTGEIMTFSPASNGMIRETVPEGSYTFKTDGNPYPSLFGNTESWQQVSGTSWKVAIHGTGGYTYSQTLDLSEDGYSLVITTQGQQPNGSAFHDENVYTRQTGGQGLMGKWKSTKVKTDTDEMLEFAAYGNDGLTWSLPQMKATLHAKFDGKDYAPVGPTVPKGLTLALTRSGPNSFMVVEKLHGHPMYKGTYTVASDGRTMTNVGGPVGQSQPETVVYDKQ